MIPSAYRLVEVTSEPWAYDAPVQPTDPGLSLGAPPTDPAASVATVELISRWPADHVAVAAVGPEGILASSGDLHHRFALASVTKPLVAAAVWMACEEGAMQLDDAAGPPGATVRHLLAHAAGLGPDEPFRLAEPGTRRIYSNCGFELLGELLEQRTGMPMASYLRRGICEPLGMSATSLDGSPASGATSTVADLAAFAQELLRPRLFDPSTIAEVRTEQFVGIGGALPGFGSHQPNPWGLGVEIRGQKSPHWTGRTNSPATFGHFGRSGTFVWIDPERSVALIGLGDHDFGPWAGVLWPALSDVVTDELGGF